MNLTSSLGVRARAGAWVVAGLAGVAMLATGCGAGQNSQTALKEPSVPGVHANLEDISLRNVQIVYPGREHPSYPQDGAAPLEVRIFNSGSTPDALVGVSSPVAKEVGLLSESGKDASGACPDAEVDAEQPKPTEKPADEPASPGASPSESPGRETSPEPTESPAGAAPATTFSVEVKPRGCALLAPGAAYHLVLSGLNEELSPGDTVEITFQFSEAGDVTLNVPFGMPTEGADHSPINMHPEEPEVVGGGKRGGEGDEGGH